MWNEFYIEEIDCWNHQTKLHIYRLCYYPEYKRFILNKKEKPRFLRKRTYYFKEFDTIPEILDNVEDISDKERLILEQTIFERL